MKVAIVNTWVPFIYGGAEHLADTVKTKIQEHGHEAILIKVPFKWYPSQNILNHILASRLIRVDHADRVIAFKFPAYYVEHDNKVLWLLHQFRQAYDLWGTPFQDIPSTVEGNSIRDTIIRADNRYLGQVKKIYTNSGVVSKRLQRFNQIQSEVLLPPLMHAEQFAAGDYGDYIFYPSRISGGKRQHLIVESMAYTKSNVKLVVAGSPETPSDLARLEELIQKHHLQEKVTLISRWISQEEKVKLFSNCLGCTYIPYDEDSYGYVTLEAYQSKKAVITCTDSGGTLDVIQNGINGFITASNPQEIAEAMDKLYNDKARARLLGQNGYDTSSSLNLNWNHVITKLLA
jgi:glycosyltransferase involved in cell wall biosynthesis